MGFQPKSRESHQTDMGSSFVPLPVADVTDRTGGHTRLQLVLPSSDVAVRLANSCDTIGRQTGSMLSVVPGVCPLVVIQGAPLQNAFACYLVQKALYLDRALSV